MRTFALLFITTLSFTLQAQQHNPLSPPNTFRQADNPYYWRNNLPHEGYWQQDVHYTIKADIDERTDIITATQTLEYWNNSPDQLHYVYFHLYQNAFQPGSYYDNLQQNNKRKQVYGRYETQRLGTQIKNLKVDGQAVETELDNTVLKVYLNKPLLPGKSIVFTMDFKTYFDGDGNVRRRMKTFNSFGYKHYDGVHWYPRIAAYDRKFGWTTDQHLGHEFYADFGCFDVELTFSADMVVEATGQLQNAKEVFPGDLRDRLDLKHFVDKPWNSPPSVITPYDSTKRKTWKYHAENVHDFAFSADPTYRYGEVIYTHASDPSVKVECIALVQEPHAAGWRNAANFLADVVRVYSEDVGIYAYPKIIAADARDGMEYPMLTLDGGYDPAFRDLIAHEVGHNWFFGMVGTNETYRASMDEGFTQFITAHALDAIDGDTLLSSRYQDSRYAARFRRPLLNRDSEIYNSYMATLHKGQDHELNTHSDGFNGALRHGGGYRMVYFKAAAMLYNLEYVLGRDRFWAAFRHYFDQWKMAHPYPEDFRNSMIQFTGVDLNWFFDQWLETTKTIDYGIKSVRKQGEDSVKLVFKRYGRMQMPIDFRVTTEGGEVQDFHIPNTWFDKYAVDDNDPQLRYTPERSATVLPRWIGWDLLHPEYEVVIPVKGKVLNVQIDPSRRLADVNMLNNAKKLDVEWMFDSRLRQNPNWKQYVMKAGPYLWYNSIDGVQLGLRLKGDYMGIRRIKSLLIGVNTGLGSIAADKTLSDSSQLQPFPIFGSLSYRSQIRAWGAKTFAGGELSFMHGIGQGELYLESRLGKKNTVVASFSSSYIPGAGQLLYRPYPTAWNSQMWNNKLQAEMARSYAVPNARGRAAFGVSLAAPGSDYDDKNVWFEWENNLSLGKIDFRTRMYGRYGDGANPAPEDLLYLGGASPGELLDHRYTASAGLFPTAWTQISTTPNPFHHGGGLNLRGYAGYNAAELGSDGLVYSVFAGQSGASVNAELEFDELIPIRTRFLRGVHMDLYLFGDAGTMVYTMNNGSRQFSAIRMDAGLGTAVTIRNFWHFEDWKPLVVRFDMPMFLSNPPFLQPEWFQFRWVLGVERAF